MHPEDSHRSLAQLLVSVMNSRELEYARVSRLLHDEVGQVLSAVGLQLDVFRMDFKDRVPEVIQRTTEIQQMLEQAVILVRDLSYELNPAIVERAGLSFALDRLVGRYRKGLGGSLRLLVDPNARVPMQVAALLYKIAEQALENAVKHSGAAQIEVLLRSSQRTITLEVRDNGKGFAAEEPSQRSAGLGLTLMEYYAEQGGLSYALKSAPGRGTSVKVTYTVSDRPGEHPE
jgi:signal transduction histidine kinase